MTVFRPCHERHRTPAVRSATLRILRTSLVVGVVGLVSLVGAAGAAIADPAHPTNYETTVLDVDPRVEGVQFEVIGGDAFLLVTADQGHEVRVPGYFNEPYIRIDADQSVYVNENSQAFYINADRFGLIKVPEDIDGLSEPNWVLVSDDGTYAWHDHRTHWMSEDLPPTVAGNERQEVFEWTVPVTVDNVAVTVSGQLAWNPPRNPLPALMAGMVALLPALVWRPGRDRLLGVWVATTGAVALAVTAASYLSTPPTHRVLPAAAGLATIATLLGLIPVARRQPSTAATNVWLGLGSLALIAWSVTVINHVTMPFVPSYLPPIVHRAAVAAVLWTGLAVLSICGFELWLAYRTSRRHAAPEEYLDLDPDPDLEERPHPASHRVDSFRIQGQTPLPVGITSQLSSREFAMTKTASRETNLRRSDRPSIDMEKET